MHIRPGFRIQTAIDEAEANGFNIPQMDNRCHFCLSYNFKGVCNTYFGGRKSHRPLSQSKFGRIGKWQDRYCVRDEAPPVQEVDTGGRSQASTLSS